MSFAPFRFKQFSMYHHRSTMKIGTDAVLLGIWAEVGGVRRILEVGTGSGVISLLLASRNGNCIIDAVETDNDSCIEAGENFANSPFSARMNLIKGDFNIFAAGNRTKYDLIISNPPFFVNDMKPEDPKKRMARHTGTLSYVQLVKGVAGLLEKSGKFCLVLPYGQRRHFLDICTRYGLFPEREMLIFPKPCKEPNRVNMELGFEKKEPVSDKFIIRNENGTFTEMYLKTVENYYISVK
jgi:tRNA1Val (adenine37-N6)-methyltransferase